MRLLEEDIADRIVVMKIAHRLHFEFGTVKPGAECNLTCKWPSGIIPRGRHGPVRRIPPFRYATVVSKPFVMTRWIIAQNR
jgi:hypothetical protein